jgi:2-keto-4-pentenoate hydratase/2-oxohepta-3-ene-1,7-dioic acid hydratase in catechol pathway
LSDPGEKFALGTFASGDSSFPGLVLEGSVFDLRRHLGADASVRRMIENWGPSLARLQDLVQMLDPADADHELADLRPLPPVQPCGEIFQAGANYHQHVLDLMAGAEQRGDESDGLTSAADREAAAAALEERARSGHPFVFLGSAHTVVGANDDVVLPYDSAQSDWEIELAAVIGRPGRRLSRERALEVVAGYTICNDLTSRDALNRPDATALGIDWLAGKNSPTFLPTGPFIVPARVVDPMSLQLRLAVNGEVMQDDNTADMLFDLAALIEHISNVAELRPGDLVLTGSPAGNGASHGVFLKPGDVIEATIEGLGTQRNTCVAEPPPKGARTGEMAATRDEKGGND